MSGKGKGKGDKKKKDGKSSKKGDKNRPESAPGSGTTPDAAVNIESLKEQLASYKSLMDKAKEQRNYFQLERDKLNAFWDITKKELEDKKAELRNKDREMEEMEERHQVEIKVYKQKVRHLLYEHKLTLDRLKTESETALKLQQDEHMQKVSDMRTDQRGLKVVLKEQQIAHEENVKAIRMDNDKNLTKVRQELERQVKELQAKYEKKMKVLREDLELRRKTEIHEIEERKNEHINELMRKHEKAFTDMKNYYNDITTNNLDLIRDLKERLEKMKKSEEENKKLLVEIAADNKRLSEPFSRALKEVEQLRTELADYEKDKLSLKHCKSRLALLEDQYKGLKWEHDVLQQRFDQVSGEKAELHEKFEAAIHEVQQKTSFKNVLLEKKVETLQEALEKKEAQLAEVLRAANLDPSVLGSVSRKLDDLIDTKNSAIKDLQYELAKLTKAHNDVIRVYESKLKQYGIPTEDLGFQPLVTKTTSAPAGLVVG